MISSCVILLGACSTNWFEDEFEELAFVDHIAAGMIEQDVFVEKVPGSGSVFRVDEAEAARFGDALVYRSKIPVRHAPYTPSKNGPYPKGASLGISLADWRKGSGRALVTCSSEKGRIQAVFHNLVPNGTYTMWYYRVAVAHMGCADCPFGSIDLPVGAKDGSQSSFAANARGSALFDVSFEPCLKPGDDQLAAALAITYHSDGNTYGPSPGERGHKSHVQLFTLLLGPGGK